MNRAEIARLAKISLHDHLDGALRPATIIELAKNSAIEVPAATPEALAAWFVDSCTGGDLVQYLKTFELTVSVMQSAGELRRVAFEYCLDLAADGVVYGEVRWAPELHTRNGLSLEEAVAAVQDGITEAEQHLFTQGVTLRVRQILCAMRQGDNSLLIAKLAVKNRWSGVVGFDLAGPEHGFLPTRHREALEYLAQNYFPTTIHAGEESDLMSVQAAIQNGALRLGHGTRLAYDLDTADELQVSLGATAAWVRDREIAIESCPSSNLQTGSSPWGKTLKEHPFDVFYRLGMRVTVSTDNRLMSGTNLTKELQLLADTFDYSLADLTEFQMNAAMAAFLPLEERFELVETILDSTR